MIYNQQIKIELSSGVCKNIKIIPLPLKEYPNADTGSSNMNTIPYEKSEKKSTSIRKKKPATKKSSPKRK